MTTYYCKCGRIVRKSTGADNTGNRLEGYAPGHECFGCPYVLPFGENRYEAGKGYSLEVKGYECRMSRSLEYASRFSGSIKDKCTCSIVSLDFDFLERVSNWIAGTYPGREIFGGFDRSRIRAVEYCSNGRYRMTVTCAQNKAGVAAKAALLEQFFNPDGSRRDLTPEQEQEKILNDIKAATKEKEAAPCAASPNPQSPTPTAAPSQSPGPGTAHGACTGTIAPGGRMETPDGSKLYFKKTAAAAACLEAEPEERPGFDYSGLDAQTVKDLQLAEREYISGKRLAGMGLRRMADGVAIAHEALCVTVATICRNGETGKFSKADQTFGAWCESVGLSRKSAERLLQVSTLFDRSSPKQQKILADLAPSLLYAAAKPSARPDLVQGVKDGDITSLKQYREMQARAEAAESRAQTAEAERDAARSEKAGLAADCNRLGKAAEDAKRRAQTAEAQRDAALADVDGLSQQNTMLQSELKASEDSAAEKDARIRELEARPVEVVGADPEDIARWRAEGAAQEGALQTVRQAVETCELLLQKAAEELPRLPDGQYRTAMQSVCKLYHWLGQLIALKDEDKGRTK